MYNEAVEIDWREDNNAYFAQVCFLLLYRHWFQMKWQLEPIMHNLHIRDQGAGMLNNQHYLLLHQVLVLTFHSSSATVHSWMGIQPLTVHSCGRCYFAECFNSWDICSVMYSHKIIVSIRCQMGLGDNIQNIVSSVTTFVNCISLQYWTHSVGCSGFGLPGLCYFHSPKPFMCHCNFIDLELFLVLNLVNTTRWRRSSYEVHTRSCVPRTSTTIHGYGKGSWE